LLLEKHEGQSSLRAVPVTSAAVGFFFAILAPEFIYSLREQIVCSGGMAKQ